MGSYGTLVQEPHTWYVHGTPEAVTCGDSLHVLEEISLADRLEALPTCWSVWKQNVSSPNRTWCSTFLLIFKVDTEGTASTGSHSTDVDTPENVFRKEDRASCILPPPLVPPNRLSRSSLHPTSSTPPHPPSCAWSLLGKVVPTSVHPGRRAPGKPWPEEQQQIATEAPARWKDTSLVF